MRTLPHSSCISFSQSIIYDKQAVHCEMSEPNTRFLKKKWFVFGKITNMTNCNMNFTLSPYSIDLNYCVILCEVRSAGLFFQI